MMKRIILAEVLLSALLIGKELAYGQSVVQPPSARKLMGILQVMTNPNGLDVMVDGQMVGFKSPFEFMSTAGIHTITVNHAGKEYVTKVDVPADDKLVVNINIQEELDRAEAQKKMEQNRLLEAQRKAELEATRIRVQEELDRAERQRKAELEAIRLATPNRIDEIKVDHGSFQDGRKGMLIHLKMNITGKDTEFCAAAHFYYENGEMAMDTNDDYYNREGGAASKSKCFIPPYEETLYNDYQLFMPYREITGKPGKWNMKFKVIVWRKKDETIVIVSDYTGFSVTNYN